MKEKIRFVDGPREEEILNQKYKEKFYELDLTERERVIWQLGFDYGVDDEGVSELEIKEMIRRSKGENYDKKEESIEENRNSSCA